MSGRFKTPKKKVKVRSQSRSRSRDRRGNHNKNGKKSDCKRDRTRKIVNSARKKLTMKDKREFTIGHQHIAIQKSRHGKLFLSAKDVRTTNKNRSKHMRHHSIVEQMLYVLYAVRWLPSKISVASIKAAVNGNKDDGEKYDFDPIEDDLQVLCDKYNEEVKTRFPKKWIFDVAPHPTYISTEDFDEQYCEFLTAFIGKNGPLHPDFLYPPNYDIPEPKSESELPPKVDGDNGKQENDNDDDEVNKENADIVGLQNSLSDAQRQLGQYKYQNRTLKESLRTQSLKKEQMERTIKNKEIEIKKCKTRLKQPSDNI